MTAAVTGSGLQVAFENAGERFLAVNDVDVEIAESTLTVIMGPSGSGKTTLMTSLGGLHAPTTGTVEAGGQDLYALSASALADYRLRHFGYIFQDYGLLTALSVRDNITLPMRAAGREVDPARFEAVCESLEISQYADRVPEELSGGTQQRVACARALLGEPSLLFADEPTGALDTVNSRRVREILRRFVDEHGITVLTVTHDPQFVEFADRVLLIRDGRIEHSLDKPTVSSVIELSERSVAP